jgi:hypothetical protein
MDHDDVASSPRLAGNARGTGTLQYVLEVLLPIVACRLGRREQKERGAQFLPVFLLAGDVRGGQKTHDDAS